MNPERIVWLNHQAALWADVICRACWQSALFCIGVWLIVRLMPRLPAAPRGWLWWLACLKPLLALACVFALPIALLPPPRPDIAVPLPFAPTIAAPVPTAPQRPAPVSTSAPHSPAKAAFPLPFAPAVQITAMPPPIAPPRLSPAAMLMAAWLIGSALCLLTLLYQYHAAYRLRRRARPIMDDALAARAANIAHTGNAPIASARRRTPPARAGRHGAAASRYSAPRSRVRQPQPIRAEHGACPRTRASAARRPVAWPAFCAGPCAVLVPPACLAGSA